MILGKPFNECYEPVPIAGCWLWTQSINNSGYGTKTFKGKTQLAHRLSWIIHRGKINDNMQILHRCDVRSCVNPDHLFMGTQSQNLEDALANGRAPQIEKKQYCKSGHALVGNNIYTEKGGAIRRCLICRNASRRDYRSRKEGGRNE